MSHLKCILWLLAWCVWLWLGFGLYRELPRNLGPVVGEFALADQEKTLGFLDDGLHLATYERVDSQRFVVRLWDADQKVMMQSFVVACSRGEFRPQFSARHGVVVGQPPGKESAATMRRAALDLRSGVWTDLFQNAAYVRQFHPVQPWVLMTLEKDDEGRPSAVVVVDFSTGRRLFEWRGERSKHPDRQLGGPPFFVPAGGSRLEESVIIPIRTGRPRGAMRTAVELWPISGETGLLRVYEDLGWEGGAVASETGRIAWVDVGTDPLSFSVFDVERGAIIMTHPSATKKLDAPRFLGHDPELTISRDGAGLRFEQGIWDVNTGVPWKLADYEQPVSPEERSVPVIEDWGMLLGPWAKDYRSIAVRNLTDSSVLHRVWLRGEMDVNFIYRANVDKRRCLYIDNENGLRQYPPLANYPLLALCQTILALPLIFLWAILRWRRKRRLRLASMTS